MNPPLEKYIVQYVLRYLRSRGGFWFKSHGGPMQLMGLPDIIGCYKGWFVGIEAKRPGRSPTKMQHYIMKRIEAAGGFAASIHSVEEAEAFLNEIDEVRGGPPSPT